MNLLLGYYPGCALHGSSSDYETSIQACLRAFKIRLVELNGWVCCGASAAHSVNPLLSKSLCARNLAIAERDGYTELLAPCPLCSMELYKSQHYILEDEQHRKELSEIVELPLQGKTRVINILQVFEMIGATRLREHVMNPLNEVRAACYYGCLLTRPPKVVQFDDCEHPRTMEGILEALGASTVKWNYATECCGAGMTMAREETVIELSHRILENAVAHGANCLVVACPMCHVNLDMKQEETRKVHTGLPQLPVYYLSDLVGLAVGLKESQLGVDKHFVPAALEQLSAPAETR